MPTSLNVASVIRPSVPSAPVNAALTALLWLESLWLRWFDAPFGSSLLCLARKPG